MSETIKTEVRDGTNYKHPSMVVVGVSRTNGGGRSLFGSSIKHSTTICLTIKKASVDRMLSSDWVHSDSNYPLIEIEMSPVQYAEMLTNMNCGDGVPATLRTYGAERYDYPDIETKAEQFKAEVKNSFDTATLRNKEGRDRAEELLDSSKPLSRAEKSELMNIIDNNSKLFNEKLPFAIDMFGEQMEKTVLEAKAEMDAYVTDVIMKTGIEAVRKTVSIEEDIK